MHVIECSVLCLHGSRTVEVDFILRSIAYIGIHRMAASNDSRVQGMPFTISHNQIDDDSAQYNRRTVCIGRFLYDEAGQVVHLGDPDMQTLVDCDATTRLHGGPFVQRSQAHSCLKVTLVCTTYAVGDHVQSEYRKVYLSSDWTEVHVIFEYFWATKGLYDSVKFEVEPGHILAASEGSDYESLFLSSEYR